MTSGSPWSGFGLVHHHGVDVAEVSRAVAFLTGPPAWRLKRLPTMIAVRGGQAERVGEVITTT